MAKRKKAANGSTNGATVGYEAQLWAMADALRGSMDAAEYKQIGRASCRERVCHRV